MLGRMKPKTLLTLAGAAGGTAIVATGVVVLLVDGGGDADGRASVRPAVSARDHQDAGRIAAVLRERGADGCKVEQSHVECRYNDRYVAAQVIRPGVGLTMRATLPSWKSGAAQAMIGDRGSFAILRGPNWLVTGPDEFVEAVRPALAGRVTYCDSPYSGCK